MALSYLAHPKWITMFITNNLHSLWGILNSPNLASNEIGTNVNAIASELDIIFL